MIRLAICVEGRTEEEFAKNMLAGYLQTKGVELEAVLLGYRGGDVTVDRLSSDMANLLRPLWGFDFVTSLVDFYGFRDKGSLTPDQLQTIIDESVEQKISHSDAEPRSLTYIQSHEFEGLLFSDASAFFNCLPGIPESAVATLLEIRSDFGTPEDINDGAETAPSKRIKRAILGYDKASDGPLVAEEIGLDTIRAECPRFNGWLTRLESLGDFASSV